MQKVQPIKKAVAGGAFGGASVFGVILVLINVVSRNYGIEIDQGEAALLAGGIAVALGLAQSLVVWRVPNIQKAVDKATQE